MIQIYNQIDTNLIETTRVNYKDIDNPVMSQTDIQFVLKQLRTNYHHQLILKLMLCTGIKPQELVNIRIKDINITTQCLRIKMAENTYNSNERTIGLDRELYLEILRYAQSIGTDGYLFEGRDEQMSWRSIAYIIEKAKLPSGERISIKKIQDSTAFHLLQKGINHSELAYLLGYKNWRGLRKRIIRIVEDKNCRNELFRSIFLKSA